MADFQGSGGGQASPGASQSSQAPSSQENSRVDSTSNDSSMGKKGLNKEKPESSADGKKADAKKEPVIIRKHKLRDDYSGQEVEVTDDELKRDWRLRKYSDQALNDAKRLRQQSEEFIKLLKTNPAKVLGDPRIGVDMRKFAEDFLSGELEKEVMDPKDREIAELKRQIQEREELEKNAKLTEEQKVIQKQAEEWRDNYITDAKKSLTDAGLPQTPYTMKRVFYYMNLFKERGKDVEAKHVMDFVKQDYKEEIQAVLGGLDGDTLDSFIGDQIGKKIRNNDIAKLKGKPQGFTRAPEMAEPQHVQKKTLTNAQWREKRDRIKQGLE